MGVDGNLIVRVSNRPIEGVLLKGEALTGHPYFRLFNMYFSGVRVDFRGIDVDLSYFTEEERRVIDVLLTVGYGKVVSYSEIARRLGNVRKARFVGNVMRKNRTPIVVPCHRVIRKDGEIGNFGWGVRWKRYLLAIEGYTG